ncbi:MAG TPA: hypothetical protein DEP45_15650 [Armatimonadetes bacterium]|nr:hypothetical protein [Armatimonadota bacterium]
MTRRLMAFAALILAASAACAADGDVTLTLPTESVMIGEPFTATVEFTLPQGREPALPDKVTAFGDDAEVRSVEQSTSDAPGGGRRYSIAYSLVLWEVGEKTLTSPAITSRAADGGSVELERPQSKMTVRGILPEGTEEIRDLRGPREMPLRWHHYVIAALPVLALIALVVLLVRWVRARRGARLPEEAPAVPLTPAEEALLALDELEREDLVGQERIKEHYVQLSWIVRNYIERRWDLPALEETTGMLAQTLSASGRVPDEAVSAIVALLRHADLAKFAKHRPEAAVAREDIERAREIVRSTSWREEVAEDAAAEVEVASAAE